MPALVLRTLRSVRASGPRLPADPDGSLLQPVHHDYGPDDFTARGARRPTPTHRRND
ncbi:hypothetical protein [Kitasatospora sp. NPDC090308]|uniref:hypothetical protein n=1 Tax=Kitasatospora sp. NPDC090308 TaxID=3364082 RepID=UPI00380BA61F